MSITHPKVSSKADGPDASLVLPSDWNAAHTITGQLPIANTPNINRLAGITATFDTFDVNPSNPGNMTDGDWTTETGEGVKSLAGINGTVGNIIIDMGQTHPVQLNCWINVHRNSGDGNCSTWVYWSDNGVNYYYNPAPLLTQNVIDTYKNMTVTFLRGRYIKINFYTGSVTINPSVFHVKVAEVMALQLI